MIEYAKRKLGEPVIMVNLDKTQMDDCIDDAIQMFCEWHRDGSEQTYYTHKVTAEEAVSGILEIPAENAIEDVVEVLAYDGSTGTSFNWSTATGQMMLSMFGGGYGQVKLSDYVMLKQQMTNIQKVIGEQFPFTFVKYRRQIKCHFKLKEDQYIVFSAYENIDPRLPKNIEAWEDQWLKRYCTALIKERWGNVLSIAKGIKLPGGMEVDAAEILSGAKEEIDDLEAELKEEHQEPPGFFIG